MWQGATVFLIGGGRSLLSFAFDFEQLRGAYVIGCNDSFKLGADLVPVITYGDDDWAVRMWDKGLSRYKGLVVTNDDKTHQRPFPHFKVCRRCKGQLGRTPFELGWLYNTGCLAIELAAALGGTRIVLLGFDCKTGPVKGRNNWYRERDSSVPATYKRFNKCFAMLAAQMKQKYPNVEILNAGPDSALDMWQHVKWEECQKWIGVSSVC